MQWTHEQSPIIQSKAPKILVRAFAGTGKPPLVGFARSNPALRILYLCYNSSVEKAANGKFPRNKKTKNLQLTDIARALNTQNRELIRDLLATLNNYMASTVA